VAALEPRAEQANPSPKGEWGSFAADNGQSKYTSLDQIDASNVEELEIVWRRPALDSYYSAMNPAQRYTSTWTSAPIVKNGIAYVPNGVGLVEAFNPGTGETIWVQEPHGGVDGLPGANTRGVAYWSEGNDRRILVQRGIYLYALNADTGEPVEGFGVDGRANLQLMPEGSERFRWGGVPTVVRDIVLIGQSMSDTFSNKEAFRGDVHAFDVRTGELRWTYNTIDRKSVV
jgi:quinoprotein glucose dehydrogenase